MHFYSIYSRMLTKRIKYAKKPENTGVPGLLKWYCVQMEIDRAFDLPKMPLNVLFVLYRHFRLFGLKP